MGYEVLDGEGSVREHDGPLGPTEVLALEDLPEPAAEPAGYGRLSRSGWASRAASRWPRMTRATWLAVAAATVAGLLVGTLLARHHANQVSLAQARARLTALASVESVNPTVTDRGQVAEVLVRVYNLGTRPIEVVVVDGAAGPLGGAAQFRASSGSSTVDPGEDQNFTTRIPLDCTAASPLTVTVPVRAQSGGVQQLPARAAADPSLQTMTQQELCQVMPGENDLDASLEGSLSRPMLHLTNNTDGPLQVTLDSDSPLTQQSSRRLSLTTTPQMPLTLPAHSQRSVRLTLTVHACREETAVQELADLGWLGLRSDTLSGVQIGGAGVDVGPLIGGAIARSCS